MWLDMSANPTTVGPSVIGEGLVDEETFPYMNKYTSFKSDVCITCVLVSKKDYHQIWLE